MTLSFALPILLWCLVSYVPFLWHPMMKIEDKGGVAYFQPGMLVERELFETEKQNALTDNLPPPTGIRANPIYLPAPHEVITAFYLAFTEAPERRSEKWLHESLWSSIQVIFWGFMLSSIIGVPLGILAGTYDFFSRLCEPFIEFFR